MSSYVFELSDVSIAPGSDTLQINNSDSVFGAIPGSMLWIDSHRPRFVQSVDNTARTVTLTANWDGAPVVNQPATITPTVSRDDHFNAVDNIVAAKNAVETMITKYDLVINADGVATRIDTLAALTSLEPTETGSRFVCTALGDAPFIVQDAEYAAKPGDITFANERVGSLPELGPLNLLWFNAKADGQISYSTFDWSGTYTITGTNNTVAIQNFFDRLEMDNLKGYVPNGIYITDTISFQGAGHFSVEGDIQGTDNGGLWQENYRGATLLNPSGPVLTGGLYEPNYTTRHVLIKNLTLVGNTCSAPLEVTITGDGTGARAYATVEDDKVIGCRLIDKGENYTAATVTFSGGDGSGAAGTVSISNGRINNIIMSNTGSGYTCADPVVDLAGFTSRSNLVNVSIANIGFGSGLSLRGAWFVNLREVTVTCARAHKQGSTQGEKRAFFHGTYGVKLYHQDNIDGGPNLIETLVCKHFMYGIALGSFDFESTDKWTQAITLINCYLQKGLIGTAIFTNARRVKIENCQQEKNVISIVQGAYAKQVTVQGGSLSNSFEDEQPQVIVGYTVMQDDSWNQRLSGGFHIQGSTISKTVGTEPIIIDNSSGNVSGISVTHCEFWVSDVNVTRLVKWLGTYPEGVYFGNFLTANSHDDVLTVGPGTAYLQSVDFMVDLDGKSYCGMVYDNNYAGRLLTMQNGKTGTPYSFWVDGTGTPRFKAGVPESSTDGFPQMLMRTGDTRPESNDRYPGAPWGDTVLDRVIFLSPSSGKWLDPGRYRGEEPPTGVNGAGKPGEWCTMTNANGDRFILVCTDTNEWRHIALNSDLSPWN